MTLRPGAIVGPYCLLFPLGKGGMGEVWAAKRAGMEGFEKIFALKVLLHAEQGSNSMVMFFDEAKATASLQHPSIVATHELGESEGRYFIVMDLVRGPSLTALLQRLAAKRRYVSPTIVAYIGQRIASALDYAYSRAAIDGRTLELIHRDVSPHNILLDSTGSVRLTDFGVARTAVQDHFSRVGTVRGKPSYMSPEQVLGQELGPGSDQFSLGIVMYESASLRRLFGRGQPTKSMRAVVDHTPTPLLKSVPGFPPALWAIIKRTLDKDADQRFDDAAALCNALAEFLRTAPGASTVERDLGELVEELFGPGAFDVKQRVQETAPFLTDEATAAVATMVVPSPRQDSEHLATQLVWPGAAGSDPFASDVIAALRQEQLPQIMDPTAVAELHTEVQTELRPPTVGLVPQRRTSPLMLLAAVVPVVLMVVVVFVYRSRTPKEIVPQQTPGAQPLQRPVTVIGAVPAPRPKAAKAPEEPAEARPTGERRREERGTPQAKASRGPAGPGSRDTNPQQRPRPTKAKPVKAAPATETPAPTAKEIMGLIRKVNAIDPQRAGAMRVTLAESGGRHDKLRQLRDQARAILRTRGQP